MTKNLVEVEEGCNPKIQPLLFSSSTISPLGLCSGFLSPYFPSSGSVLITAARVILLKPKSYLCSYAELNRCPTPCRKAAAVASKTLYSVSIHLHTLIHMHTHTYSYTRTFDLRLRYSSPHPWSACRPWTTPGMFLSYGLHLSCSLCLEHSSLGYPLSWLPKPSWSPCSNVSSTRPTPSSLFKIATCCFPFTLLLCCHIYWQVSVSPARTYTP